MPRALSPPFRHDIRSAGQTLPASESIAVQIGTINPSSPNTGNSDLLPHVRSPTSQRCCRRCQGQALAHALDKTARRVMMAVGAGYVLLTRVAISVLHCRYQLRDDGTHHLVVASNGALTCFQGAHTPLAVLAGFTLVAVTIGVPLSVALSSPIARNASTPTPRCKCLCSSHAAWWCCRYVVCSAVVAASEWLPTGVAWRLVASTAAAAAFATLYAPWCRRPCGAPYTRPLWPLAVTPWLLCVLATAALIAARTAVTPVWEEVSLLGASLVLVLLACLLHFWQKAASRYSLVHRPSTTWVARQRSSVGKSSLSTPRTPAADASSTNGTLHQPLLPRVSAAPPSSASASLEYTFPLAVHNRGSAPPMLFNKGSFRSSQPGGTATFAVSSASVSAFSGNGAGTWTPALRLGTLLAYRDPRVAVPTVKSRRMSGSLLLRGGNTWAVPPTGLEFPPDTPHVGHRRVMLRPTLAGRGGHRRPQVLTVDEVIHVSRPLE